MQLPDSYVFLRELVLQPPDLVLLPEEHPEQLENKDGDEGMELVGSHQLIPGFRQIRAGNGPELG